MHEGARPFLPESHALGTHNPPSREGLLSTGSFLGSPVSMSPPLVTFNEAFPTLLSICRMSVRPGHHFIIWRVLKDTDAGIPFPKTPPRQVCGVTHVTWLHIGPHRGSRPQPRGAPRTTPGPWSVSSPEVTATAFLPMASTSLCPGQGSLQPPRPPLPPVSPRHLTLNVPGAEPLPSHPSLGKQVRCLSSCPGQEPRQPPDSFPFLTAYAQYAIRQQTHRLPLKAL